MTPTHDTAAALEAAIDDYGNATAREAMNADERATLHRAITAHVEAEVARRLAGAPDVEVAIVDYALAAQSDFDTHEEREALRAAIAADKARAVEAGISAAFATLLPGRPTPDEARRLVDDAMQAAWGLNRPSGQSPDRREAARERATAARTALLRALGVEA